MKCKGLFQGPVWLGRIQQQRDKLLLRLPRKTNHLYFSDRSLRGFLGRGNHKIADGSALNLSSPPHDSQALSRNPSLQPSGFCTLLWHRIHCTSFYRTWHYLPPPISNIDPVT
jgi:hypothetical protein